jgi:hypothetical protein
VPGREKIREETIDYLTLKIGTNKLVKNIIKKVQRRAQRQAGVKNKKQTLHGMNLIFVLIFDDFFALRRRRLAPL